MGVKVKTSGEPMRIGELSRRTGASARSLRHYGDLGLLPSDRDASGYRRYDASAVDRVAAIRRLLAAGFNLEVTARLMPCLLDDGPLEMCPAIAGQVRDALADLDAQARDLAERRTAIERLVSGAV